MDMETKTFADICEEQQEVITAFIDGAQGVKHERKDYTYNYRFGSMYV